MSSDKNLGAVTSITSTNHLDVEDHEIDLHAVASNPISIGDVGTSLTSDQKMFILKRLNFDGLISLEDLPIQATFMFEKIENISIPESLEILQELVVVHKDDINIPTADMDLLHDLINEAGSHQDLTVKENLNYSLKEKKLQSSSSESITDLINEDVYDSDYHKVVDWNLQVRLEAALIAYHSPYPEVRAVTDPYDDPSIPVETVRMYIAGIIWTGIGCFINQFFIERQPNIGLSSSVVQVFLYPTGTFLSYILPKWKFKIWKFNIDLNPGPWTHKEQMLATLFFSVTTVGTYVTDNINVQKIEMFYNTGSPAGYQILLILSSNFLGFGLAGILRKFVVYPIHAVWPTILPTIALNKALMQRERKENINGWTISKYKFFFICFGVSFVYYWIPDFLFNALQTFNWMTWIRPNNFNLAAITGTNYGLGLNPIPSFDWNILSGNSPLIFPFYNQICNYIGMIIGFVCIVAVYWTNHYWTAYLPINNNRPFTNTGEPYLVTHILNDKGLLDKEKYEAYGPPFYTAANLVVYGAFFALYPFAIVYECSLQYRSMWNTLKDFAIGVKNYKRSNFESFHDPHSKMMSVYKEVPDWVFLVVLVISLVFGIICIKAYPTDTPVWGLFFSLGINVVFLIPIAAIASRTGFSFGLNVLVELIVGYAIPGNGLALNYIKAFGYNIGGQADNYISDQKMAHYVKIPPRALFRCQMLAVLIQSFISYGVINFTIDSIKDYCQPFNKQKFTCPGTSTFYTASVLWGVIGPKRVFGGLYPVLKYCFLAGFLMAIPCIFIKKYAPRGFTKYFEPTIIIGGVLSYAPYNLSYYTGSLYLSIIFMKFIKERYESWWKKYNYILSCGLSSGLAFSSIIIFFAVDYKTVELNWWGNIVSYGGIEGGSGQQSLLNATAHAPDGYFGPRIGHFP
ncbi:OPT oligopeptide transporter protein-domain-containing protein [Scheffersomyces coipomensis]|uniref:OPT oligopeptide transporter protein-domain-containing protein n=1 Tax=Scheffersomyces coipomensis TaxID=1788519 RepID=UPI00315D72D4